MRSCSKLLRGRPTSLALLAGVTVTYWWLPTFLLGAPTISYVQSNYATPQTAQITVNVTFTSAQAAGDLNVVAVGWNDGVSPVSTVTDRSGNTYTRAVGPTSSSGTVSQSIYYAKNIVAAAAGTNTVTVTFSTAATNPDIRILEYQGADPNNPVDVTAAASGNTNTTSSGSVTTTNPTDLLFGANMVYTLTTGVGSGFTGRLLTSPDGDIAEDRMVNATGSYAAAAPLNLSGPWVMQMVAFRTPSGGTTSPTVSSVSPNTGSPAGGTAVTITPELTSPPGATVSFGVTSGAQRSSAEQHHDHSQHSGGKHWPGDGDRIEPWGAERKLGERVHLWSVIWKLSEHCLDRRLQLSTTCRAILPRHRRLRPACR